jgi:hypothetical protein
MEPRPGLEPGLSGVNLALCYHTPAKQIGTPKSPAIEYWTVKLGDELHLSPIFGDRNSRYCARAFWLWTMKQSKQPSSRVDWTFLQGNINEWEESQRRIPLGGVSLNAHSMEADAGSIPTLTPSISSRAWYVAPTIESLPVHA